MSYARTIRVEFNHCDPAGIVFYPRYFEMTNSVCENFFREVVGYSYHAMMVDGIGVPMARIEFLDVETVAACAAWSGQELALAPHLLVEFHGSPQAVAEQAAPSAPAAQ